MSLLESQREGNVVAYPGLVKPYVKEDGKENIANISRTFSTDTRSTNNRPIESSKTIGMNDRGKEICDPYSIYDDDHGVDFYYVPPQGENLCLNEWRRTVRNSKSLRNFVNTSNQKESVKDRTLTFPPYGRTTVKDSVKPVHDQGEYCYISTSHSKNNNDGPSIIPNKPSRTLQRSISSAKELESLREFAQRFAVSETSEARSHSSVHSFHDRRKINTSIEMSGIDGSDCRISKHSRTKIDDAIDICTCMLCVKGLFYHCTEDSDDDFIEDPCSCSGSKLKVAGRWLCLGIFSILLPCFCCYLPARGCHNLCRTCKSKKRKDELLAEHRHSVKVKYSKEHCPKQKGTVV